MMDGPWRSSRFLGFMEVGLIMRVVNALGGCLAAMVMASGLAYGAGLTSGLQPGKSVSPFDVLNCNGPSAGKTNCQI
jgi:hypothetical protein